MNTGSHITLPESQWPTESIPTDPESGKYEIGTKARYRRLAKYIDSQDEPRKPTNGVTHDHQLEQ